MFRSIRWSLLFWHSLILLFVTSGFAVAMYYQQAHDRQMRLDAELDGAVRELAARARAGPDARSMPRPPSGPRHNSNGDSPAPEKFTFSDGIGLPEGVFRRFAAGEGAEARYFAIWRQDGVLVLASDPGLNIPFPGRLPNPPRVQYRDRGMAREAFLHGPAGSQVLVGASTIVDRQALQQLLVFLLAISAVVLCIGLLAGWLLASQILRPISSIQHAAEGISETNLARRIDLAQTHSELGGLARVLNSTFARLQAAFERQLRFAADASHELRTPLSVIHTKAEVTLSKPRSTAEYVDALETCLRSAKRMRPLVDSLLLLARADAGRLELKLENIDLSHMAVDCAAMLKPLADDRGVTMQLDLQPTIASVDPFRVTQVLANLLTNAILYNRRGGTVTATIRPEGQDAVIVVTDTGVGIAGDRLEKIFDRFYRVEESRSRELGGAGLGLAICQSIITAHSGTITVNSEPNRGSTFTVRLPVMRVNQS